MRAQVGKYYFGRHRSNWGIWQWECVTESGCAMARFVKDVYSYEDAVKEVYSLNGWGTTQSALANAMTNGRGESRELYATTAFYDVTKGAWRSFRWESLVQVF